MCTLISVFGSCLFKNLSAHQHAKHWVLLCSVGSTCFQKLHAYGERKLGMFCALLMSAVQKQNNTNRNICARIKRAMHYSTVRHRVCQNWQEPCETNFILFGEALCLLCMWNYSNAAKRKRINCARAEQSELVTMFLVPCEGTAHIKYSKTFQQTKTKKTYISWQTRINNVGDVCRLWTPLFHY